MKAPVFEIKRFAVHDGDGIRTTVFLKGCTLECVWCHNPEGISFSAQLAYYEEKCINCGGCVGVCNEGAHIIKDNRHFFDRNKCVGCGKCVDMCLGQALVFYGKEMSVDEVMDILLEDKAFYETSSGGVTLSGGECLCHADFCSELLKRLKKEGINTAVDTCGFISQEKIDKVIDYTDVFLYDIKAFDSSVHKMCTGHDNDRILKNIKYIDSKNKSIEVRIPYVPGFNSDQIEKIGNFLGSLKNITKVRVLPYHNFARSKYMSLDMEDALPENVPTTEEVDEAKNILRGYGLIIAD